SIHVSCVGISTLPIPSLSYFFFLMKPRPPRATLFPYTTLFRSNGSGTITLTGVVAGDDLGATGTFTFFDKNAGSNKTVTLSGIRLEGDTSEIQSRRELVCLLVDVLQKAISGTVTVDTKTYDGSA